MTKKDKKYYLNRLKKFLKNPIKILKIRKLVDIKFWQNVSDITKYFSDSWVVKINQSFLFVMYIK